MKLIAILFISLCSTNAFASHDYTVRRSLEEIQAAKVQTRVILKSATGSKKQQITYVLDRLNNAENILMSSLNNSNYGGGHGGGYPSPPVRDDNSGSVSLYTTDSCNSGLIGTVNAQTNCSKFRGAQAAWGIKVNGRCENIADMSAEAACEAFKILDQPPQDAVRLYRSDSCSGPMTGIISLNSRCDTIPSSLGDVWAVSINGKCLNIVDTSVQRACVALKGGANPNAIGIYNSDSCSGSLVSYVDSRTRCESLRGMADAWGITINGRCENIADTDIVSACERFKPSY